MTERQSYFGINSKNEFETGYTLEPKEEISLSPKGFDLIIEMIKNARERTQIRYQGSSFSVKVFGDIA